MEFVDTHAHIYLDPFIEDLELMLQRAKDKGVSRIYLPNIDVASINDMLELEAACPDLCVSMIGLHPCSVKEDFEVELRVMEDWLERRLFAGIGETGTDLYWDKTFLEQQVEALTIQAGWARQFNLPIILHSRDSLDLSIQVIEKCHTIGLTGIFHCFTGSPDQAKRIIDLGFFLGIGGVATFKNSGLDILLNEIIIIR